MTTERHQLHSTVGRQLLLAYACMPWLSLAGCFSTIVIAITGHAFTPAHAMMLAFLVPLAFFSRWARRNATPVFATSQGLELAARKRTIPWSSVAEAHEIPFVGNMLTVYRVTFTDGTPPLTFYCREHLESIVQRFKSPARAS